MTFEFKLPDVGEGIHEARLLEWCIKVGDHVKEGDQVASMETDKVVVDLPSPHSGVVASLHGEPGDVITVGTVIMVIDAVDTPRTAMQPSAGIAAPSLPLSVSPSVSRLPVMASPSIHRFAREMGVNLANVAGSGPDDRILRADVETAAQGPLSTQQVQIPRGSSNTQAVASDVSVEGSRRERLSGARAVSAKNLHNSVQRSVTTTSTFEVLGDGLRRLTAKFAPEAEKQGLKLSPLHVIAKCTAAALVRHERFNATIDEATSEIIFHQGVDLGIAMAGTDKLVVPVVRGIDRRPLRDVVKDITELRQRANDGRLKVADLKGGSFTISSTGGLERATMVSTWPIINPPQTAILWVSRITERPRVIEGQLTAGPMMVCSLSFDHRYIDGSEAAHFINDLADYLERPEPVLDWAE